MDTTYRERRKRMTISLTTADELEREDIDYWRNKTTEERLDMVERLPLEAGKFLYEYPARLRRVIEVIRK